MEQVRALDTHPHWRHLKTGRLCKVVGLGLYKGGVNEMVGDMADVVVKRPVGAEGWTDLDVVPGHYTVADVKTADAAKMQTDELVKTDDRLVVYECNGGVWATPFSRFYDGRFVKVDEAGKDLAELMQPAAKKPAKPAGEPSQG